MAGPTKEQKRVLDEKLTIIEHRIALAGGPKRAIKPGVSRKEFHKILDKASRPIKREIESDSEQP